MYMFVACIELADWIKVVLSTTSHSRPGAAYPTATLPKLIVPETLLISTLSPTSGTPAPPTPPGVRLQ
jgi:hypothetical protein